MPSVVDDFPRQAQLKCVWCVSCLPVRRLLVLAPAEVAEPHLQSQPQGSQIVPSLRFF